MNPITRWWRSKGHGIHSPYAYRMVTEVLPERGRYYAYDRIERLPDSRRLKLIFRLVCEFMPTTVHAPGITGTAKEVILLADPRVRFTDNPTEADLLIGIMPTELREGQAAVMRIPGDKWDHYKKTLTRGMTFSNGSIRIAVNRHGLPRQDFESRF